MHSNDPDVSTKSSTNTKKYDKLKGLKERRFRYKKDMESDSVTSLIADLHVELIFLNYKISLRLLDYIDSVKHVAHSKENAVDKEFENLLGECKNSKIWQALLFMGKVLYLNSSASGKDSEKVKQEQRALADVS